MSAELITAIALIIGAIIQGWKTRAEVKKMAVKLSARKVVKRCRCFP